MTPYSPVSLHQAVDNDNSQARGFFTLIKHWMGRIISTGLQASVSLYCLIFRVRNIADPIIQQLPEESPEALKKGQIKTDISPTDKNIPSPILNKEEVDTSSIESDDIFEEEEEALPILESFFSDLGFININIQEVVSKGLIFDTNGKKLDFVDLDNLTGNYQVEWNFDKEESGHEDAFILLYRGQFEKGVFHGQGGFSRQESDGSLYLLLEGTFERGAFNSGMMILKDSYIEGTFNKGYRSGKGVIRYFKINSQDNQVGRMEYHGEFTQGIPHGKGKVLLIGSEIDEELSQLSGSVKVIAEGEFKNAQIVEGRLYQDDGRVLNGKWPDEKHFQGMVISHKEEWSYEGICVEDQFEGPGKLTIRKQYEYEDLAPSTDEITGEEVINPTRKEGYVQCIYKGEFKLGQISSGEQIIYWPDDKIGSVTFENGRAVKTEISTPDGLKYIGEFDSFTLDGQGQIYNSKGQELYSGSIKCGFPHGKGHLTEESKVTEGIFEWGRFVGPESPQVKNAFLKE